MKAINIQKTLITTALLAFGYSGLVQANVGTVGFSFTTVPDVSISTATPINFGTDLRLATGTTCTLIVTSAAGPGHAAARLGSTTAAAATFEDRTGDCEPAGTGNSTGTAGIYNIVGANGVEVSIQVNPILPNAANFFSFVPTATAATYDGVASGGDTLVAFGTAGSAATGLATLASPTDTGVGSPIPGQTKLFVGGTLTAQQQLTAGTTYNLQEFTVDVIYN